MSWRVLCVLLFWSGLARAADIVDATGRSVAIPDHVARVLPAGPPAAVLLEALAPDLMLGWPSDLSPDARALLAPSAAALPQIPRLTGRDDVTAKIQALRPDLIVDYGNVSPRYADLAHATQDKTGTPTILLDGHLAEIPRVLRQLGAILHRPERAESLALLAEALLSLPQPRPERPRVVYARGVDGLNVAAPDTDVTEVFTRLGWQAVAPEGQGTFRKTSIATIAALDPDLIVFADPHMHDAIAHAPEWQTVRAVREAHAIVAPDQPFGWIEEPPSLNRLLGLGWLGGGDGRTLATFFNAVVYGRVLTPAQRDAITAGLPVTLP